MPWNEWERERTGLVVASINAVRIERGMTVKALRDRLEELGWKVSLPTLNGMLSAKKRGSISVAEVEVIARALEVPPAYLVLGLPQRNPLSPLGTELDEDDLTTLAPWWLGRDIEPGRPAAGGHEAGYAAVDALALLGEVRQRVADIEFWNAVLRAAERLVNQDSPLAGRPHLIEKAQNLNGLHRHIVREDLLRLFDLCTAAYDHSMRPNPIRLPSALDFLLTSARDDVEALPLPIADLAIELDEEAQRFLWRDLNPTTGTHRRGAP